MSNNEIESAKLEDMTNGWFIGDFEPSVFRTPAVEVGVKRYKAGAVEKRHYHKIAREFTVIVEGEAEMEGKRYKAGDIVIVPPGAITGFTAITDVVTTVVKVPGVLNDKYVEQ